MFRSMAGMALAIAFVFYAQPAHAQKTCSQASVFDHAAATGPVELVKGVANQRVYLCGFFLSKKGQTLDLQIWSGDPNTCSGATRDFTPHLTFPNDLAVSNRLDMVGVHSEIGQSLCIQTFGQGALGGIIYWEQF